MVNPLDLKYLKNIEGGIGLVELTKNINSDDLKLLKNNL